MLSVVFSAHDLPLRAHVVHLSLLCRCRRRALSLRACRAVPQDSRDGGDLRGAADAEGVAGPAPRHWAERRAALWLHFRTSVTCAPQSPLPLLGAKARRAPGSTAAVAAQVSRVLVLVRGSLDSSARPSRDGCVAWAPEGALKRRPTIGLSEGFPVVGSPRHVLAPSLEHAACRGLAWVLPTSLSRAALLLTLLWQRHVAAQSVERSLERGQYRRRTKVAEDAILKISPARHRPCRLAEQHRCMMRQEGERLARGRQCVDWTAFKNSMNVQE